MRQKWKHSVVRLVARRLRFMSTQLNDRWASKDLSNLLDVCVSYVILLILCVLADKSSRNWMKITLLKVWRLEKKNVAKIEQEIIKLFLIFRFYFEVMQSESIHCIMSCRNVGYRTYIVKKARCILFTNITYYSRFIVFFYAECIVILNVIYCTYKKSYNGHVH